MFIIKRDFGNNLFVCKEQTFMLPILDFFLLVEMLFDGKSFDWEKKI